MQDTLTTYNKNRNKEVKDDWLKLVFFIIELGGAFSVPSDIGKSHVTGMRLMTESCLRVTTSEATDIS